MKTITKCISIIVLANLLSSISVFAQAPNSFKYQAVLRDASGNIKASTNANIRIDILQGSASGTNVFAETFTAQTNAFGLINLEIGKGTIVSGNITTIDWSAGTFFIKISVDGTEMGTSQLLSVPYALYAAKAGNAFSGNYTDLTNKPINVSSFTNDAGYLTSATESDPKIGNNTANYIPKWNGTKLVSSTISDNGKVGIDVANPAFKLDINGSVNLPADSGYRINNKIILSTKGTNNNFIGYNTGIAITTGINNNLLGNTAGKSITSGSYNNFIGYQAGNSLTTSMGCEFVGRQAGYYTTAGANWNCFFGDQSGYNNTTGYANNFFGGGAGYSNTSGSYNVCIGGNSGVGITTGSDNIVIGYGADVSAGALSNATVIGYNATVSASNTMVIGNSSVIGWGFGTVPGTAAIKVGSSSSNGNGATLTLAGVWTNASDSTKKYDILPINYGLKEVLKLRPVSYKMKGTGFQDIGFIAQEVKLVLPEIVYGKEGEMTLSYGQITAVITKAIQEQQKEIDLLKQQNAELLQIINELKKK